MTEVPPGPPPMERETSGDEDEWNDWYWLCLKEAGEIQGSRSSSYGASLVGALFCLLSARTSRR